MRLETPSVLGLAASALWSVTYYTTTDCSGAGKEVCWRLRGWVLDSGERHGIGYGLYRRCQQRYLEHG
jgi:hypothetical protein